MRKIALILAVLVAATASARADVEVQKLVDQYYAENVTTANEQEQLCVKPRSNTTAKCHADFNELYDKVSQTLGAQLLYRKAREINEPRAVQFYWNALQRTRTAMLNAAKQVRELYYPVQSAATTGQRSGQPKVIRTGK